MKKNFKLVLALVVAIMMVLGSVSALADDIPGGTVPGGPDIPPAPAHDTGATEVNETYKDSPITSNQAHTITINNTDEQAKHTYEAYQIFVGDLNAPEGVLSNIAWGNGVNSAALIAALKDQGFTIANGATAADIAKLLDKVANDGERAKKFAAAVGSDGVLATVAATSTQNATPYTLAVSGDGYYFIKDKAATLDDEAHKGEHYTKFMLQVVKDVAVNAKDTHTNSDKVIVEGSSEVNDNDKAIGDTVTYKATLDDVPDPARYNRYKLEMSDTMEKGLTLTGIGEITLNDVKLTFGTDYYYYVGATKYDTTEYAEPTDPINADAPNADTQIRIVFKDAKSLITTNNAVGKTLVVNYTAVLNKNAEVAPNSNDNTNHFIYSNNPNHTYEGDEITNTDPKGETPDKTVETYTTALEILKYDATTDTKVPLPGAIFSVNAEAFNRTLVTAEEFVEDSTGEYWALIDGSYTTQDPNATGMNQTQYKTPLTTKYKKVTRTEYVMEPTTKTYTLVSDAQGKIYLKGVKEGTYTITEVAAPDGFNKVTDTFTIVIDWDHVHAATTHASPTDTEKSTAKGGFKLGTSSTKGVSFAEDGAKFSISIDNKQGVTLPSTGGIGTTIFYVAGSIMVLAAAILLITKRRMGSND